MLTGATLLPDPSADGPAGSVYRILMLAGEAEVGSAGEHPTKE
jgi:hypothetical protein